MAKETKQERIADDVFDQISEHMHQLKQLEDNESSRESDVEKWCESVIKNCLGYTATAGYQVRCQESRGNTRPDMVILYKDKPVVVIEVKKQDADLDKSDLRSGKMQLAEYLDQIGDVRWGILTNGHEWRMYDFKENRGKGVKVFGFDVREGEKEIDLSKGSIEDACLNFADLHEISYSADYWDDCSVEAAAVSPESLARAILHIDSIKCIGQNISDKHDFKAPIALLADCLLEVLSKGLNEAVDGWNETRQEEFKRFVTKQKKAATQKKRRSKPKAVTAPAAPETTAHGTASIPPTTATAAAPSPTATLSPAAAATAVVTPAGENNGSGSQAA